MDFGSTFPLRGKAYLERGDILAALAYAAERERCTHVIIDGADASKSASRRPK